MDPTIDKEVESAIHSVTLLITLTSQTKFNRLRFEDCRNRVLRLNLPSLQVQQLIKCLQKANRYARFGEIGAFNFELTLMIDILKNL